MHVYLHHIHVYMLLYALTWSCMLLHTHYTELPTLGIQACRQCYCQLHVCLPGRLVTSIHAKMHGQWDTNNSTSSQAACDAPANRLIPAAKLTANQHALSIKAKQRVWQGKHKQGRLNSMHAKLWKFQAVHGVALARTVQHWGKGERHTPSNAMDHLLNKICHDYFYHHRYLLNNVQWPFLLMSTCQTHDS